METYGLLFFLAIVALFIALFWYFSIQDKRKQSQSSQELKNMGFEWIEAPDRVLLERITDLCQTFQSRNLQIQNIYIKRLLEGDLYVFDLIQVGNGEEVAQINQVVCLVSSRMHLPHFVILPRISGDGFLSNLANRFLAGLVAQDLVEIPMGMHPAFHARYTLMADSELNARSLLTPPVLDRVSRMVNRSIEGSEDMIMFMSLPVQPGQRQADLSTRIQDLVDFFHTLQSFGGPASRISAAAKDV